MLSDAELNELAELYSKATPGPWSTADFREASSSPSIRDISVSCSWPDYIGVCSMENGMTATVEEALANTAAIVALFNAFPSLAATIRASEARIKELEAERDQAVEDRKAFRDDWRAAEHACVEARHNLTAALAEVERLRPSADRYAKLRSIGAAPNGTTHLENGLVLVAQLLDEWIDKHWGIRTASSARPFTPAPDRGVPGRDEPVAWVRHFKDRSVVADITDDPDYAQSWRQQGFTVEPLYARATHPAPPEWRDATEAAAKVAWPMDLMVPGKAINGGDYIAVSDVIKLLEERAAAIRALPPPSTSASPWRDIAENYKVCLEAIVNADNATDLSLIKRRARCSLETAGTNAIEGEDGR